MREYVVDVSHAASWDDFIAAFNQGFVRQVGGEWHGNLDAFNDYLFWPDEHPYHLVIQGWHSCFPAVNEPKTGDGKGVLEIIAEIFRDNPQVEVALT
jgi:hypothetical protein